MLLQHSILESCHLPRRQGHLPPASPSYGATQLGSAVFRQQFSEICVHVLTQLGSPGSLSRNVCQALWGETFCFWLKAPFTFSCVLHKQSVCHSCFQTCPLLLSGGSELRPSHLLTAWPPHFREFPKDQPVLLCSQTQAGGHPAGCNAVRAEGLLPGSSWG